MGDLDMATLEADFDQEDEETISSALRMAAESAMAHTSGGGRRIRTASSARAPAPPSSSPPPPPSSSRPAVIGGGGGAAMQTAEAAVETATRGVVGTKTYDPSGEQDEMGMAFASPSAEALAAYRKLEQQQQQGAEYGSAAGGWGGGDEMGAGGVGEKEWAGLSPAALKRKTVTELKGYLDEEGVAYPDKAKKAELVNVVSDFLAS